MAARGRLCPSVLVGVAGAVIAAGAVWLHVAAGTGLPTDAARALSVQLPITAIALVLAVHRPENRLAPLALLAGTLLGLHLLAVGVLRYADAGHALPDIVAQGAFAALVLLGWPLTVTWVLALLAFPEGSKPPARAQSVVLVAASVHAVAAVGSYLTASPTDLPAYLEGLTVRRGGGPFPSGSAHDFLAAANNVLLLALPAAGVLALVAWRRRSGPVVRQQLKWLLPALALQVVVHLAFATSADPWHGWRAAGEIAVLAAPALGAVAIAVAVFRYRLWEIDAVISKALVFALLSAVVTVAFVLAALGAALLIGGTNAPVLTALAVVLACAAVSRRPRQRAERAVRRLVYGERPQGFAVLGGLGDTLAAAGDANEVAARVADAVRQGLSTPWAAVWLHVEHDGQSSLEPVGASGTETHPIPLVPGVAALAADGPRAACVENLPPPLAAALSPTFDGRSGAVAPLVAAKELVGVIACGDRFREPLEDADLELLSLLAREAALGLANRRLEAELRLRLADLRQSRQRLVSAQDAERRRVERDLHDGVQARLVHLASQMRQLAAGPEGPARIDLTPLAVEAEEIVFELQDFARGIYPSVLTDHGLPAALRAQAARMPLQVQVAVCPSLAGHRLPADTETALYFVALEALGNAQKHAGEARVQATLRVDDGPVAVLEVSDDGPGFDPSAVAGPGRGLVNMHDRMAAIGGTLAVDSGSKGSSVAAAVQLPAGWPEPTSVASH